MKYIALPLRFIGTAISCPFFVLALLISLIVSFLCMLGGWAEFLGLVIENKLHDEADKLEGYDYDND